MHHLRRVITLPRGLRLRSLAICAVVLLAAAMAIVWWLPIPGELQKPPVGTLTLLDCRGREIAELASPEARTHFPVMLDKMGPWLPRVTVTLEDRRFTNIAALIGAQQPPRCARNLRSRHLVSGASTITQQLVKLATGREQRSWNRKLYEAIIAWKLERRWSKERILAEYLNRSSYGNRRIGPEAASRAYFDKPARDLTLSEAIFLAVCPRRRRDSILGDIPSRQTGNTVGRSVGLLSWELSRAISNRCSRNHRKSRTSIRRTLRRISLMPWSLETRVCAAQCEQRSTSISRQRSNVWFVHICRR